MIISIKSLDGDLDDFKCIYLCTQLPKERAVLEITNIYINDIIHPYGERSSETENPFGFKNVFYN